MVGSPLSTAKHSPHVPLKCGYICKDCRLSHIHVDHLLGKPCAVNTHGGHRIVKKAVQCQNCRALGDCTNEFLKETCLGKSVKSLEAVCERAVTPEPPAPPSIASEDEVPEREVPAASELDIDKEAEMVEALLLESQAKLRKLQLLKELEIERVKLQELLARKSGEST